ncbi:MAG: helix-turn-helix transcriptional regulator [Bacteroides sp.]
MESWERIEYIIKKEGLNKNSFSKAIGISNNVTITRIINERRAPSRATCEKIISAFPLYNLEWLLTGEGEMLKDKGSQIQLNTNNTNKGVPYFEDIEASCSILEMPMSTIENPTFYIDYEHFNDCTAYIPVVGDSMYPQYCAGEIVAVKKVNNPNILQWGEAYLVITNSEANDLRTIKLVHQSENNDEIILRASNPDYKGDTIIPKKDIISMFIIKGKIKRNQL